MIIEAPAKINLSLRVLGRRDDGFHDIESVMVRLPGLHDRLSLEKSDEDSFTCNIDGLPVDDSNLVIKARNLFRKHTGSKSPVSIHLEKVIPHGAGLGGGSSDAAATLSGLNDLLEAGVSQDNLMIWSAEIGSDIPFFLGSPVASIGGRGEKAAAGPELPAIPVLLLKPSFGIATPEAYKRWKDAKPLKGVSYKAQEFEWGELINDLECPVFSKHLFLAELKQWLLSRDEVAGALMSGSGSTTFAVLKDLDEADALIKTVCDELDPTLWAWSGFTAASVE